MRKSWRTLLTWAAALLLAAGLTAVTAAPQAKAAAPSATATLTPSGCDLTLTYTWSNFNTASRYVVAIQQREDATGGYNAVIIRGYIAEKSGSESITYTVPAGTTGTFRGQGWLYRSNGREISGSMLTTADQTLSCP